MSTESRVWCEPASEPKEYGSGDTPPELRGKVGWRGWPPLLGLGLYSFPGAGHKRRMPGMKLSHQREIGWYRGKSAPMLGAVFCVEMSFACAALRAVHDVKRDKAETSRPSVKSQ